MKKRFFSLLLVLCLLAAAAIPVLADEGQSAFLLTKVTVTSGGTATETAFVYENGGWLPTQVRKGEDVFAMEYDDAGRITFYTAPTYTQQMVYDEAGHLAETTWQGESSIHTVYTYDEAGQVIRQEQTTDDFSSVVEYVYDEHGHMISQTTAAPGGEPDVNTYTYEYDDAGLALSQTYHITQPWGTFTGTYTYEYDDEGRLTRESYDDGESLYYYMPLLSGGWSRQIWTDLDGGSSEEISLSLGLRDTAGEQVMLWTCPMTGEPEMEYDDNGCLVKAADADGNMIELSYGPVA